MRGWSRKAGPSPTGGTRMRTLPRRRGHRRQCGACGAAMSFRRGIGGKGSVWGARGRRLRERAGGAASRATSARTARASTTCRAGVTTTGLESTRRRGSGGSAPRTRHERRDGAAQGNSLHAHGAAHRRRRVQRAAKVAGRWNCAPRSVPDISRDADATLLEPVHPDSRPEARPGWAVGPLVVGVEPGADDTWIRRTRPGRTRDSTGRVVVQRRVRMPPKVGRGGRCRRNSDFARGLCSFVGDARLQGKRRRPRRPPGRVRTPARRIGSARGRIASEAQRGSGAGPHIAIQSLSESLRRGDDREKNDANTKGWINT